MSRIGSDPVANAPISPIYTSRANASPATQAATGHVGGHTVQLAPAANAPAHSGGIGDKIRSFFGAVGKGIADAFKSGVGALQGLFTRAPQAQAPAAPAPAPAPAAHDAAPAENPQISLLKSTLPYQLLTSEKTDFQVTALSAEQRAACSYAFARSEAQTVDDILHAPPLKGETPEDVQKRALGVFMRSNAPGNKLTSEAGNKPENKAIIQDLVGIIGDREVGTSTAAYGVTQQDEKSAIGSSNYDPKRSHLPSMKGLEAGSEALAAAKTQLIKNSIKIIDGCMCATFGTPGQDDSIKAAAERFPQSLCDQLGILFKGINDSACSDDMKAMMKMNAARDAIGLRSLNAQLGSIVAQMDKVEYDRVDAQNRGKPVNEKIPYGVAPGRTSLIEVMKVIQTLVNGHALTKDFAKDFAEAAETPLTKRWNDAFPNFVDVLVARADPTIVNNAVLEGATIRQEYDQTAAEIATCREAEGKPEPRTLRSSSASSTPDQGMKTRRPTRPSVYHAPCIAMVRSLSRSVCDSFSALWRVRARMKPAEMAIASMDEPP